MTHTTLPDEILKTDALGRVRTPKARREALLAEFARSGSVVRSLPRWWA